LDSGISLRLEMSNRRPGIPQRPIHPLMRGLLRSELCLGRYQIPLGISHPCCRRPRGLDGGVFLIAGAVQLRTEVLNRRLRVRELAFCIFPSQGLGPDGLTRAPQRIARHGRRRSGIERPAEPEAPPHPCFVVFGTLLVNG
jgi:hypothetical protein